VDLTQRRLDATMSHPKHAASDHDILDVIRRRWSPRAFDPTRDVSTADLKRLFEAARWAPSSFNEQPWRFVVASRARTRQAYEALVETLVGSNRVWAAAAPVLVLVAINPSLSRTGDVNQHAWYDTGQAVGFLTLQATALDLAIRQMEGFDHARAAIVCDVPPSFMPAIIMAVGYAGDPASLPAPHHRDAEARPRLRRPLGEFVFDGAWGRAFG
jgi:nitroreductase